MAAFSHTHLVQVSADIVGAANNEVAAKGPADIEVVVHMEAAAKGPANIDVVAYTEAAAKNPDLRSLLPPTLACTGLYLCLGRIHI